MSFRYFLTNTALSAVSAFILASCLSGSAFASTVGNNDPRLAPPVLTYADQAAPLPTPAPDGYYDSPLSAGTLTLQDVLEAHKPNPETPTLPAIGQSPTSTATAPLLTPPTHSSSTSLMLSQGMKEVLQKVGDTTVAPVQARPQPLADNGQPIPLVQGTAAAPTAVPGAPDLKYEPGQAPKNLASEVPATTSNVAAPVGETATSVPLSGPETTDTAAPSTTSVPGSSAPSCDEHVQKWEKNCGDAGYPATYVGRIVGETHTSCTDGTLHDIWVTNTCAPPDQASTQSDSAKVDAECGSAANNQFDEAPSSNLCARGNSSAVNGNGPWTWACSGMNGGAAASCNAQKRVAKNNGACGSSNGVTVTSAPNSELCSSGRATPVQGNGPWTWSCKGTGGGASQSCIAPVGATSVSRDDSSSAASPSTPPAMSSSASAPSAPSEKGELCGIAAETLAYEAPNKDLCRAGTPSVVNGDGPWTWSCTDNEGRSSSCRTLSLSPDSSAPAAVEAAPAPIMSHAPASVPMSAPPSAPAASPDVIDSTSADLACGAAATQATMQAPEVALCENGKASSVHGSGPWHWTCTNKAHRKISCETPKVVDGSCGAANGTSLKSAPFGGLCASGTPTAIEGNGPWNWICNGSGGGINSSCAASSQSGHGESTKVEGTCGANANTSLSSIPRSGLCASGVASAVSGEGPWTWSCSGSNGGGVSTCSANKLAATQAPGPAVNGLCGFANGATTASTPVDGLCSTGSATTLAGNGPWNWSCLGENGGMSVSCTAPLEPPSPVDGACGPASGNSTLVKPVSGLCSSGITGTVSGRGPWTWTCSGANGGSAASCVAPVAGRTGSMPSLTNTPATSEAMSDEQSPPPAHSGLVTPQLPSSDMPSLDHQVLPKLTPSKSFGAPPTPSSVPSTASVSGTDVPRNVPTLPDDAVPVTPPALRDSIPSAPVLQEIPAHSSSQTPGNHLTLDPTISTVLFSRGSANIDDTVLSTLDKLSAVLQANADVRITLTAYADNTGSTPRDARRLSLARALAVRDYLGSKNISDSRIDVRAEGANTASGYIDRVDVKVNE